ncbi:MAG: SH3 domain-containing protein [Anaerolineaceae bacterium]|nr:SH3 domain-containing protein [Anaerolineaceae bacterium]MCB9101198.1 SH3 domain-containing protein [Anaerolineales bacterium]
MKTTKTIVFFFILVLLTTACGSILGKEEGDRPEPLNKEAWPTLPAAAATLTPTPFPRATIPPTTVPAAAAAVEAAPTNSPEPSADAASSTDLVSSVLSNLNNENGSNFAAQIRSLSGVPALPPGLAPVGIGVLVADQAIIRQGPGESYGQVQVVNQGELAGVLGRNEDRSWVYVITLQKSLGWLPIGTLRITSSNLDEEPVLPPNPLASFLSQASASAAAPATSSGASTAANTTTRPAAVTVQPLDPATLSEVTTARVTTPLNMRQRPGPDFKQIAVLPKDEELSILARNQDGFWVLVKTSSGDFGWVSLDFLEVDGSIESAPEVRTLDADAASNEVGPIVEASAVAAPAASSAASTSADQPAAATTVSSGGEGSALPVRAFAPVASARVAEKTDGRKGPGESFGAQIELTVDQPVDILARNEDTTWVVVRNPLGGVGWVALDQLKDVEGFLENAVPVTTAWVKSNETTIYNGPGIFYEPAGNLAIFDMVAVLGMNENRNWAFIEALNGGRGWVQPRLIELAGSYDALSVIKTPAVAEGNPANEGLPAPSANSATSGQMVFQTSSGGEIKLINADGSGLRTLTAGIDPVLSPDGRQVAFTRWIGDIGELWVINSDGSNERQILGEMHQAKGPDWSPDGSQVVLNFQKGGRLEESHKCQPFDTNPNPPRNAGNFRSGLNNNGEFELCWTVPPDPNWSLRTINIANSSFEDLYGGLYAFRPAWDPSQPWRVVSDSGAGLLSVSVDDPDTRQEVTSVIGDSSPVFSPDGRYIAVTSKLQNEYSIFRMNSDGSGRVRLTQTPLWVPIQADTAGQLWNDVSPTWSPDGSLIAFLTDRTGRWEIWLMNADGSNQRPMFSDEINDQLDLTYNFVDERAISWR